MVNRFKNPEELRKTIDGIIIGNDELKNMNIGDFLGKGPHASTSELIMTVGSSQRPNADMVPGTEITHQQRAEINRQVNVTEAKITLGQKKANDDLGVPDGNNAKVIEEALTKVKDGSAADKKEVSDEIKKQYAYNVEPSSSGAPFRPTPVSGAGMSAEQLLKNASKNKDGFDKGDA